MRLITYDGRTQSPAAWAKEIGISRRTLWARLAMGWPLEQAALYRMAAGHPMEKVLQPTALSHPPEHPLAFNGQTKSLTEWANDLGISQSALSQRLSRGWPLERALSWRRKPKE